MDECVLLVTHTHTFTLYIAKSLGRNSPSHNAWAEDGAAESHSIWSSHVSHVNVPTFFHRNLVVSVWRNLTLHTFPLSVSSIIKLLTRAQTCGCTAGLRKRVSCFSFWSLLDYLSYSTRTHSHVCQHDYRRRYERRVVKDGFLSLRRIKLSRSALKRQPHYLLSQKSFVLLHMANNLCIEIHGQWHRDAICIDEDTGHKCLRVWCLRQVIKGTAGQVALCMKYKWDYVSI